MGEKTKASASPETIFRQMFSDAIDKHRYEWLEWDISWSTLLIVRSLSEFVPLPLDPHRGNGPTNQRPPGDMEGQLNGITVYLDHALEDGQAEIRTSRGEVVASAYFPKD